MRQLLLPIVVLLFASTAIRADGVKDLNGTWIPSEGQLGGEKAQDEFIKSITLTITDGKYSVVVGANKEAGTFTIDATKKPATMDVNPEEGPNKGKKLVAIYELSGDTMKVCYKLEGTDRPKEFTSTKDDKQFVVVYKRKK
jgi:uncharacterized protein (TIGR03067 family)